MYRFKRSLIPLIGVLALVGIMTVSLPHIGRGRVARVTTRRRPKHKT
jgi:hypothetical protein